MHQENIELLTTAQEAGQIALKARMHFETYAVQVANDKINEAAIRGHQSCTIVFHNLGMPELCAKRLEGLLNKVGYSVSHKVSKEGVITMAVSWLKSIEDFPLLAALPTGK